MNESHTQKTQANKLFALSEYSQAVVEYDKALSSCPNYLEYEIAVLRSNISACHIKLGDWKAAVESANAALEGLERLQPKSDGKPNEKGESTTNGVDGANGKSGESGIVEVEGNDEEVEAKLKKLDLDDQQKENIQKIKVKAMMRRAKAKDELGGWSNLQQAEDDYKTLASMPKLAPADTKIVQAALRALKPKIETAKQQEMGEMMGKLKDLGNGLLKPFGLSTDMFNMVKDEKTGGYSMSMSSK